VPVITAMTGSLKRRIMVQAGLVKKVRPYLQGNQSMALGMVQVMNHLLSSESSNFKPTTKKSNVSSLANFF
jgi:hypothetical protein